MNRPDLNLPDLWVLLGQRVTVTQPGPGWERMLTGKLTAITDQPTMVLDLDDGRRMTFLQSRCKVTPADDTPPEPAYLAHPIPAILTFPGQEPLHITARLAIDVAEMRWWADLNFHPLKPPAADTECTLRLPGGEPGLGRIAAGSTRMLGEGLAPTIGAAPDYGQPVAPEAPAWHPWFDNSGEPDLLAVLRDMLANLQAHIDQRAAELAQPRIEEADERVAAAEERCRELKDASWSLRREHDRRTGALERRVSRAETGIARALATINVNTANREPSDYQRGYQACADHVTRALSGADQDGAPV